MYRNILALCCCSLFITAAVRAQVAFGVQTGPTFSDLVFYEDDDDVQDYDEEHDRRFGWGCGIVADIPFHDRFSLRPELAYRRKGYTETEQEAWSPGSGNEYRWTFDYLDLALLARYYPNGGAQGVHLFLGPSIGRLLGVRVRDPEADDFDPDYPSAYQSPPVGIIDPEWIGFGLYDIAINGGIGYLLDLGGSWFDLEFRYQYGLSNVHNGFENLDVNGALIGEINSANRCFMFNIGWLLPVGGKGADDAAAP